MSGKESKISQGLVRLLSKGTNTHFNVTNNIFMEDPSFRVRYVELFNHAQVVEIAQSGKHNPGDELNSDGSTSYL